MPYSDRDLFLKWWADAWTEGLWAASWEKSIEGLTPDQAAWQPPAAPGSGAAPRKSIWQIVEHMIFWRQNWLGRIDGGPRPTSEEQAERNFPEIRDRSPAAWESTRRRFKESHDKITAVFRTRGPEADPMMWFLPHDAYHFGQINYIRAMLGLPPLE